jgi:hypothetical protein
MIKKLLGQEVDSWQWVGKRWKRNRVKHKQTENDKKNSWDRRLMQWEVSGVRHKQKESYKKNSWDGKLTDGSGYRRLGIKIESNTSRQPMIKKNSWDGKLTDGSGWCGVEG